MKFKIDMNISTKEFMESLAIVKYRQPKARIYMRFKECKSPLIGCNVKAVHIFDTIKINTN